MQLLTSSGLRGARARALAAGLWFASALLAPSLSSASEVFPSAIHDAANMPCVPQCTLCHTVNPGTSTTFTKPLAIALLGTGKLSAGDSSSLKEAFAVFAADAANQDKVAALAEGKDPYTGDSVCGPRYGCGARLAKAPPEDSSTPGLVLSALVLGVALRQFRRVRR